MFWLYFEAEFQSGVGLGQTDHRFKLSDCDSVWISVIFILAPDLNVIFPKQFSTFKCKLRFDLSCNCDILLKSFHIVSAVMTGLLVAMDVDDKLAEIVVWIRIALITHYKEQIETRHDGSWELDIILQRFGFVVATEDRVGCCQNRCPSVKCGIDSSFGDRNCLLFHSLMDCNLIFELHFVKLINAANTIISQHQSTCLDSYVSALISSYTCSQTSSWSRLTVCIDWSWYEFVDTF